VALDKKKMLRGGGIVATVMSNLGLEEYLKENGLELFRSDVGDKHVLEIMNEKGINFGGEQSGHVILHDFAKTGDGLMSALNILSIVLESGKQASEVLRPFALYPQQLRNMNIKEKKPLETIEGLKEHLEDVERLHMRHLIRYSGTENKLRILLEGKDAKVLDAKMNELEEFFAKKLA
jgi:phosphoglucosamine mutase